MSYVSRILFVLATASFLVAGTVFVLKIISFEKCTTQEGFVSVEQKSKYPEKFYENVTVTAYTNARDETNKDEYTALMEKPVSGWTCAVSRDLMKYLGMKVYIEGHGMRYVNDLMNKRYTNRIDVYVGTKQQARNIGKTKSKVIFID